MEWTKDYASKYVKDYHKAGFKPTLSELMELAEEVKKRNWSGVKEEAGDALHHGQLYLSSRGVNTPVIPWTVEKYGPRRKTWEQIYQMAGVPPQEPDGRNHDRPQKVVSALGKHGVPQEQALAIWKKLHPGVSMT